MKNYTGLARPVVKNSQANHLPAFICNINPLQLKELRYVLGISRQQMCKAIGVTCEVVRHAEKMKSAGKPNASRVRYIEFSLLRSTFYTAIEKGSYISDAQMRRCVELIGEMSRQCKL